MNKIIKLLAYFFIPVHTILFTRGYNWFTTNFSVIGSLIDRKRAFFIWGLMVGVYYFLIYRAVQRQIILRRAIKRLIPSALVLLFCAVTTPYLPETFPFQSLLHIVFAFMSTVLLLLFLIAVCVKCSQTCPGTFKPFLYALGIIIFISVLLLAFIGIVSSALEIFLTMTTVVLSARLSDCLKRQGKAAAADSLPE